MSYSQGVLYHNFRECKLFLIYVACEINPVFFFYYLTTTKRESLFNRIIQSQWAQTVSKGKLLCHCWNYPRIHRQPTMWKLCWVLEGLDGGNFLFPPLLSAPPPNTAFVTSPSSPPDEEDWCHATIERDTKMHQMFLSSTLAFHAHTCF